jgi:5-formyltetrahydrofolate cyclo-ligase
MNEKEKKAELRKLMLAKRDELSPGEKAVLDASLCDKILKIIDERRARVIHTYLPFGSEPDIYPLIQRLLDEQYTVICPKSLPKRALENLVLHSLEELEEGRFGTRHPANGTIYRGSIDLFIVPCIAFGRQSYRLGYGSGYYDKFFAGESAGYKLGIGYPFQLIDDFPAEAHDVPLDASVW